MSQNLQQGFIQGFEDTLCESAERRVAFSRQRTAAQVMLVSAGGLVASLIILIGFGVFEAEAATLLTFLFIMSRMIGPLGQIQSGAQQIFHSLPAYRKIKDLEGELSASQPEPSVAQGQSHRRLRGTVLFRNVSFFHDARAESDAGSAGVADIDLSIEQGEFVGLEGESGAGKSTLCDLMVGLYPPTSGVIKVDDTPLRGETVAAWRSSLSYVSQDTFLFHDSIRSNLLWAQPQATEEEIWAALDLSGAEGFVRALKERLDTVVGERGMLLSGGERQRIALARALMRRPSLLVLDEATNAVDQAAEGAFFRRLQNLAHRPTTLIVSHRPATLGFCDRVIQLQTGRVSGIRSPSVASDG